MRTVANLILLRHGESTWNRDNRFTGWADVDLTEIGIQQVLDAATALRDAGLEFDVAYTSVLKRCIRSQWLLLDALNCMWLPQILDWRLNERHYGALTGQLKSEAVALHGEAAVRRWRRSYDAVPPAMDTSAAAHVVIDRRYAALASHPLPGAESLHDVVMRVASVWHEEIGPALQSGRRVLVTGHGNGLRALVKIVEGLSDEGVASLEVGNSAPIVYALDKALQLRDKWVLPVPVRALSGIL
jgi:2,3-bisphosphoglycerate-dependent phosphoglycerate mutase